MSAKAKGTANERRQRFFQKFGRPDFSATRFCFKEELPLCSFGRVYPRTHPSEFIWVEATQPLIELCVRSADGDRTSLSLLLQCLVKITGNLSEIMRRKPDLAKTVARKLPKLPVLIGRNAAYLDYAREFVNAMEVGADYPLNVVQSDTRGRKTGPLPSTPKHAVSLTLIEYIDGFRAACKSYNTAGKHFGVSVNDGPLPQWGKEAICLKTFSQSTAVSWANLGIKILEETFGKDLAAVPRLAILGASAKRKYARSARGKAAASNASRKLRDGTELEQYYLGSRSITATERSDINTRIREQLRESMRALARPN